MRSHPSPGLPLPARTAKLPTAMLMLAAWLPIAAVASPAWSFGGRLQVDAFTVDPGTAAFGSGVARIHRSGLYLRRLYLTVEGRFAGFNYLVDTDVTDPQHLDAGLRNAVLGHRLAGGTLLIGQRKPWRSFDELASNNDVPFVERNVVSANGILDIDYTQGVFYERVRRGVLRGGDNLWWGAAAYSLQRAGQPGYPRGGFGGNLRLAWAPWVTARSWLHLGVSFSRERSDGRGLSAGYSTYYAFRGTGQQVVQTRGATDADLLASELAAVSGPLYLQAEYAQARYFGAPAGGRAADAYSLAATCYLTGESRRYLRADATEKAASPLHRYGAVELALRYDAIRNPQAGALYAAGCVPAAVSAGFQPARVDRCAVSSLTLGVNYQLGLNFRLMLDFTHGVADLGGAGRDAADAYVSRLQWEW